MKIKKLFCLLAAGVMAVSSFAGNAFAYYIFSYEYDCEENARKAQIGSFTYFLKDYAQYGSVYISNVAIVVDIPNIQKVEIPEKVTYAGIEFTVTDLDMNEETYPNNKYTKVEEIVLPESIYNISSFSGFNNLKKMNIPKNTMFGRCRDYIPKNGVYVYVYSDKVDFDDIVDFYYLAQCPKLKLSVDPNNPYYSYKNDFLLSKDGKTIYISFNKNTNLIIPDGIEEIEDYGGIGFKHVKNVKFPETLKHLSGTWRSLESIKLPSKLEILGGKFGKSKFTKVVIPDSVKTMYTRVFYGSNIKSVKIGKGLTVISSDVFANCKNLKSVTIPKNIKEIDNEAFKNCKKLRKVNIRSKNVNINYDAFRDCKQLRTITIRGAKEILYGAFNNCKNLKNITINKVKKIDADAFYSCKKLSKIIIKNSKSTPKIVSEFGDGNFKNTNKGIKFVVKNKKIAKQLKKQLSKKKYKKNLKNAKILVGKKVVYKV